MKRHFAAFKENFTSDFQFNVNGIYVDATVSLLAQALHVGRDEVRKWIDLGWLQSRIVQAQSVKVQIIDPDDFCSFVKQHGRNVVGRRLTSEGLSFVRDYVFPRPHADLLSVRGPYNKEPKIGAPKARMSGVGDGELDDEISGQIS